MKNSILLLLFFVLLCACNQQNKALYSATNYTVYPDKVVQDSFMAHAVSAYEMCSNYQSAGFRKYSPTIEFKFSINSHDNELPFGKNHVVTLQPVNGKCESFIEFGKATENKIQAAELDNLAANTIWNIKLDMRKVFKSFEESGYYACSNGDVITKTDFNAVYIAGSSAPLSWDFSNLYSRRDMELQDKDGDGIFDITLVLNSKNNEKLVSGCWKLSKDISQLPTYKSEYLISDAIYNLSLEEMLMAIEKDSTFRTGKEWAGVWTRDISYSIFLSMAYMQPEVAKISLMRKVKNDRIIQDTGTGGAYPVSTDRIIWSVAAWELYKVTGDKNWLQYAYKVIKNSIEDDMHNAFNPATGLMKGESSFLDWREQSYPQWMLPADIYQSENLGTNAAHYQANIIAAKMALLLNDIKNVSRFNKQASIIKNGINQYLWQADKNYHGQFLYGRDHMMVSDKAETLGEALTILFDINTGEQARKTVSNFPVTDFGVPCIYPQIPGIPPYHNNGIWPFVQTYWALASAKTGNEKAVMAQIAAIYRAAAMFLTNKENYVAENGDFAGTQINSSVMLWSLSGNLALVHRILFGIEFQDDKLIFHPFVPEALNGKRSLKNFRYRNAMLDIEMEGYGNQIESFSINGKESVPEILSNLTGENKIRIVLKDKFEEDAKINMVNVTFTPETPVVTSTANILKWTPVKHATQYSIYKNGRMLTNQADTSIEAQTQQNDNFQVIAIDSLGNRSFASAPIYLFGVVNNYSLYNKKAIRISEDLSRYIFTSKSEQTNYSIDVNIPETGKYALKIKYANGNGPVNTDSKCAIRTLYIDNNESGVFVFPQRGTNEWQNIGFSNILTASLSKGVHQLGLKFMPFNENMNGDVNEARLYEIQFYKLNE